DEDKGESKSSDRGTIEVEVDVVSRIDIPDSMLMPDVVEYLEKVKEVVQDIYGFLDHVVDLERSNARLRGTLMMAIVRVDRFWLRMSFMAGELRQIHRFRNYDWMSYISYRISPYAMSCDLIMTNTRFGMTPEAIEELINQLVVEALAAYEANHAAGLVVESESQNRNGDGNGGGNGNENEVGIRNGNPNRNDRGSMPVARKYTYHDFVKCQPLNVKGT
ncbi:hypothetical protein Tco_1039958, partial [Tanacetum coccineum]